MSWQFDTNRPIYLQLIDRIKIMIATGELVPGEKLKSVREWAEEVGVNPNTMQRALQDLERDGYVYAKRTSGRYITEDLRCIGDLRGDLAKQAINQLKITLGELGYKEDEWHEVITNHLRGK